MTIGLFAPMISKGYLSVVACRGLWRTFRSYHSTRKNLTEEEFDITQILKSNTAYKGFNDIEKKKLAEVKSKKSTKTKPISDTVSPLEENSLTNKAASTKTATVKKSSKSGKSVTDTTDVSELKLTDKTKSKKSTKTTVSKSAKTREPQKDVNGKAYKVTIPDWMEIVLDSPSNPVDEVDSRKLHEFRSFVEELELRSLPSVTTVIKKTEPAAQAQILKQWTKRKTLELGGEEQFQVYRQKLLTRGSTLHSCIEKYLAGERDFQVEPHIEGAWESIQHVLPQLSNVRETEKVIAHPELFYKGQIDCLATFGNDFSLVEWKVSSKPKIMLSQTYDNPLQVAAYIGALNRSGVLKRMEIPSIKTGVLVITYEDGEPASIHEMNEKICNKYWSRWTGRLYHYWALQYQEMMTKK